MAVLRLVAALAFVMTVLAGCTNQAPAPSGNPIVTGPTQPLACRVLDARHQALPQGTCLAEASDWSSAKGVDAGGTARFMAPANATVTLTASYGTALESVRLVSDHAKSVTFTLTDHRDATPDDYLRTWQAPVTVKQNASGEEPQVAVDQQGNVFYSPAAHGAGLPDAAYSTPVNPGGPESTGLYRSIDGGKSFLLVAPQLPAAIPTRASDTSVSIAPDGSVWWSRYFAYASSTIGCTSADHGSSWTCDNVAVPGVTDRMWIVGLSKSEGYLQSGEALEQPQWVHSTDGSLTYTPYATQPNVGQLGNLVYDDVHKAVWQATNVNGNFALLRIDGTTGTVPAPMATDVPGTFGIGWVAVANGTLWTTGEVASQDGSAQVSVAHSSDMGHTWTQAPVSVLPKSATFSYASAGANGRAVVVYYGSDKPGAPNANGGEWSVYAAESNDANAPDATWVETQVVPLIHKGDVCLGLACDTLNDNDHHARFSGDLIGSAVGPDGAAHLAYIQEVGTPDQTPVVGGGQYEDRYVRQT